MAAIANVKAVYFPVLDLFRSREIGLEQMFGIHIMPHPERGAYLVALNGHMCALIHDESGQVERPVTILVGKDLLRHCRRHTSDQNAHRRLIVREDKTLAIHRAWGLNDMADELAMFIQARPSPAEDSNLIEGKYPDVSGFMRKAIGATPYGPLPVPAEHMAVLAKAQAMFPGAKTSRSMGILCTGAESPAFIRFSCAPEFLGAVMPMKLTDEADPCAHFAPDWLVFPKPEPKAEEPVKFEVVTVEERKAEEVAA